MALSRKYLQSFGLTEEQAVEIIEANTETIDGWKRKVDKYREDAERLPEVLKELEEAKKGSEWERKYNEEHKAFEDYKAEQLNKANKAKKTDAYKSVLKELGVNEQAVGVIVRGAGSEIDALELDESGAVKDIEALKTSMKESYGAFISVTEVNGARTQTPPANSGKKMTKAEIFAKDEKGKYKLSSAERQAAIMANPDAFGR